MDLDVFKQRFLIVIYEYKPRELDATVDFTGMCITSLSGVAHQVGRCHLTGVTARAQSGVPGLNWQPLISFTIIPVNIEARKGNISESPGAELAHDSPQDSQRWLPQIIWTLRRGLAHRS